MKLLFTLLTAIMCFAQINAQPGSLDVTFGDKGKVISTGFESFAYTSLLQPDGKIVVGGLGTSNESSTSTGYSFLARYNTDGSPDLLFGSGGRAFYNPGQPIITSQRIYATALQPDGKVISAMYGYNSIALMRVDTSGSIDKSFGVAGLALGNADHKYSATDMNLLPDGRIFVTGNTVDKINDNNHAFIACFMPDGTADKSFGSNGVVVITLDDDAIISSNAVTKEGKIVLGGEYLFQRKILLLRYNSNGTEDDNFGVKGAGTLSFDSKVTLPSITNIAITADNRIQTAGVAYLNNSFNGSFLASRFQQNGMPDSSFGTNGYTVTSYAGADAHATGVALQANGRTLICGYLLKGQSSISTVARYDKDGIVDSTFGINGIANTSLSGQDESHSILVQKDGKIVVSGFSQLLSEAPFVTTLVRYNGDDSKKLIIVTNIKRWLQHHGITWQTDNNVRYYNVQRSTDGGISFQQVAKVYNNHQLSLTYEDGGVNAGANDCYRIASTAKDGSKSYSNNIFVNNTAEVKIFPNPVRANLQLYGLSTASNSNISVLDLNGNIRSKLVSSGSSYSLNTSFLTPGNYVIKIQNDNTVITQSFTKQ